MGAQNALWLAAQVLLGPGRRAVVENPGYPGLRAFWQQRGAGWSRWMWTRTGCRPRPCRAGVDVVFTTASHQCPTNATMPLERRLALLEAAAARGFRDRRG